MTTVLILLLLAVSGCGGPSYKASPAAPIPDGLKNASDQHAAPMQGESRQYSLLAEPYSSAKRQQAVFDADFGELGIIAIQLKARNAAGDAVRVRRVDMTLTLPDGHRLSPMSAHSAASVVEEKTGTSFSVGDVIWEGLFGINVQSTRDLRRADTSRTRRAADYERKELSDALLSPGAAASGFVFFRPPPGTAAFDKAVLNVMFAPVTDATGIVLSRPVEGLAFAGIEANPAATTYISRSQRGFKRCSMAENSAQPWTGTWKTQSGRATLTVEIADGNLSGKITTPTHVYRIKGVVNGNGAITASIEHGDAGDKASLSGNFPKLRTSIDSARPGAFWPLSDLIFRLCN